MVEQTKQSDTSDEPKQFGEVLDELFGPTLDSRTIHHDPDAEAARRQAASLTDSQNEVRDAREVRSDLIERQTAGEGIDPAVLQHSGHLLLEAQQRAQQALADQDSNNQGPAS